MTDEAARRLVQPGDPAPNFTLPAVNREGSVALQDYRGKVRCWSGCSEGSTARSAAATSRR